MSEYNIYHFYNEILETNRLVGNQISDNRLIKGYTKFTSDEFYEIFEKGIQKNDNIEILDGIIDSLVTGYFLYCLKRKNTTITTKQTKKMSAQEIAHKLIELKSIVDKDSLVENIEFFIQEIFNIGMSTEFDIFGAAKEVNQSNFTKFPLVGSVDPNKELKALNDNKKYRNCYYKIATNNKNQKVYVFFNEDGKYIKPSSFKEPNLKPFIPKNYNFIEQVKPFIY